METKHTKGTWWACCTKSIPHYVFANEGEQTICAMIQKQEMGEDLTVEEMQANAKLIAAAPELLEALQILLKSHRQLTFQLNNNINDTPIEQKAQEAINKAIGYEQNSN